MQTEEEFLSQYNINVYDRPSVTADVVAFGIRAGQEDTYRHNPKNSLSVLLIKRGEHPYIDCWALPGGFVRADETVEQCAHREIQEETGVAPAALMLFGEFSEPKRDPRGRIISNAFLSVISEDDVRISEGTDASETQWFNVEFNRCEDNEYKLTLVNGNTCLKAVLKKKISHFGKVEFEIVDNGGLAFDHAGIIATAFTTLQKNAENFEFLFDFMPEKFTLTSIQKVQETILQTVILPANFRRKIADYVVETEEYLTGAGHRPAKLFKKKERMD